MTSPCKGKWDAIYQQPQALAHCASTVLLENQHLLPKTGRCLDVACGLGGNAFFLAKRGLRITAWDISTIAIRQLRKQAKTEGLTLSAAVRDVEKRPPLPNTFNIITVSRFLSRALLPALAAALKKNGLIFYQTFTQEKVSVENMRWPAGPRRHEWLLRPNELLHSFSSFRIHVYREEGSIGDTSLGLRNEAILVAQKC